MNKKPYSLGDAFGFGKYHNKRVHEIIDTDPEYIKWLITQTKFELDNEAYTEYRKHIEPEENIFI